MQELPEPVTWQEWAVRVIDAVKDNPLYAPFVAPLTEEDAPGALCQAFPSMAASIHFVYCFRDR